jgi:hypothetical protein
MLKIKNTLEALILSLIWKWQSWDTEIYKANVMVLTSISGIAIKRSQASTSVFARPLDSYSNVRQTLERISGLVAHYRQTQVTDVILLVAWVLQVHIKFWQLQWEREKKKNAPFGPLGSKGRKNMPTSFINKSNLWLECRRSKVHTSSFHGRLSYSLKPTGLCIGLRLCRMQGPWMYQWNSQ